MSKGTKNSKENIGKKEEVLNHFSFIFIFCLFDLCYNNNIYLLL